MMGQGGRRRGCVFIFGGDERKWVGEKGEEEREGVELPVSCIMLMRPE